MEEHGRKKKTVKGGIGSCVNGYRPCTSTLARLHPSHMWMDTRSHAPSTQQRLLKPTAAFLPVSSSSTVRIGYRVTGYNDLPGIMIGLTKIKIKTSKRHSKYHYCKTPLISTYVFSGLATVQVLIFGGRTYFRGV